MSKPDTSLEEEKVLVREKIKMLYTDRRTNKYLEFFKKHNLIIRPNIIWDLMYLFEHLNEEKQKSLIEEIQLNLEKCGHNSLILVQKTIKKQPNNTTDNILNLLINLYFKLAETSNSIAKDVLNLASNFFKLNKFEKTHLETIFSTLSTKFYDKALTSENLYNSIRFIYDVIAYQAPHTDQPQSFFYFSGIESGLVVGKHKPVSWPFKDGFGLSIWFYLEEANEEIGSDQQISEMSEDSCPKLFTFHSEGNGGIEAYFVGNKLYYRILSIQYSPPNDSSNGVLVSEFKSKRWYYLGLEHEKKSSVFGRSQFNIVVNNDFKKSVNIEFPKISAGSPINKFVFGQNMVGKIASAIVFQSSITQVKLSEIYSFFNLGIQTENAIKNLNLSLEKTIDKISFLFTPIRVAEDIVYDVFGGTQGELLPNSGYISKDYTKFSFSSFGGINVLLPYFYFLRYIDDKQPNILNEYLRLMLLLLKNNRENQNEAKKNGFFKMIGVMLSETEKTFFNSETIYAIAELKNSFNDSELIDELFVDFIWKTEIYEKSDLTTRTEMWSFIRTIYLENPNYYNNIFGINKILDLLIDKYDAPFKKKASSDLKGNKNSTLSPDFQDAQKVLNPILNIIEAILETGGEQVSDGILYLANTLALKCSPYLHVLILKLLKKSLVDRRDDSLFKSKLYMKMLMENKVVQNILHCMNQTNCLDVKAMCVKFLNVILTHPSNTFNELEIAQFISSIIWNQAGPEKTEIEIDDIFSKPEVKEPVVLAKPPKKNPIKAPPLEIEPVEVPEITTNHTTAVSVETIKTEPEFTPSANTEVDQKLAAMSLNLKGAKKKFEFGAPTKSHSDGPKDIDIPSLEKTLSSDSDMLIGAVPTKTTFKKKNLQSLSATEPKTEDKGSESAKENAYTPPPLTSQDITKTNSDQPETSQEPVSDDNEFKLKNPPSFKSKKPGMGKKNLFIFEDKEDKPVETKVPEPIQEKDTNVVPVETKQVEEPPKEESVVEKEPEFKLDKPKFGGKKPKGLSLGGDSVEVVELSKTQTLTKKNKFSATMTINTDEINDENPVGGEHGAKKPEEDENQQIDDIIADLARQCVEAMRSEVVQQRDFFDLKMPVINNQNKLPPPSVKGGSKKMDFSKTAVVKPSLDVIKESNTSGTGEEFNLSNSLDQTSPEQTQLFALRTTPTNKFKSPKNVINDKEEKILGGIDMEPESEALYNSVLEWLLHKTPTSLEGSIMIDDTDKINSISAVYVLMRLYKVANEAVKEKIIRDIYMLVKWNPSNCASLLGIQEFQFFLLDILYHYQIILFSQELKGMSAGIWELGIKIHSTLMRHAMINDSEGYKRFHNLSIWAEMKRVAAQSKPRPVEYEKGATYLIRYLCQNLLDALHDLTHGSPPSLQSNVWRNVMQMTFYTQDLVTSAFHDVKKHNDSEESSLSGISKYITRWVPEKEDYPYNFKTIFSQNYWVDWKLCESLVKLLDPIWTESLLAQTGITTNMTESQKVDKRVSNLMNANNSDDHYKILEIFFTEVEEPNRGTFLKVLSNIVTCYTEDAVKMGNRESLKFGCDNIEKILKTLLVISENIRERNLKSNTSPLILSHILYLMRFVYQILNFTENYEVLETVKTSIVGIAHYLIQILDHINSVARNLGDYDQIREEFFNNPQREIVKNSFTLISFELVLNYLSQGQDPIINFQTIKALKHKDLSALEEIVTSEEWKSALTEGENVKNLINRFFFDPITNINSIVSKGIQNSANRYLQLQTLNEKSREENHHKLYSDTLNCAVEIYEWESQKKQMNVALDEENVRKAKNQWKKIWKKLRIYVGIWKHPNFYDQHDKKFVIENEKFEKKKKNEYFTHRIAKYETKSRMRPFLKVKLIEPKYVEEFNKRLRENRANVLHQVNQMNSTVFLTQNTQQEKEDNRFSFFKSALKAIMPIKQQGKFDITKLFSSKPSTPADTANVKDEVFLTKKCQWIKTLTLRNGYLQITSQKLIFILDGIEQKENHIAFSRHSLPDDRTITKEWPLNSIKEIQKRRYILRKSALEIYMMDGTALLFNFPDATDLEEVSQKLIRMRKTRCQYLVYYGSLDPRKIIDKAGITKKWMNHEMSNFEYLMQLNALSGRSYKDLTQYPVFPWIISDLKSDILNMKNPKQFRDLTKTMGSLGNDQRTSCFVERFESADPFNPVPKYHFGSHYSSPAIILQYLIRLAPYTQGAIQLQSGKFDLADRLFSSMEESYKGATEEISDVRELIPEFYYLPEFLINLEKLDFGKTQLGVRVDNVECPKWSKVNPYRFVALLRQALESEIVSKAIHNWIDLIFGYKQKGKEAEKALNVFYHLTYEDEVDLKILDDPTTKISYESQIVHFGQTPSQLFLKPHPARLPLESIINYKYIADPMADIRVYRPPGKKNKTDKGSGITLEDRALLKMKIINESRMIGIRKDGNISYYKWWSAVSNPEFGNNIPFKCGIEKEKSINLGRGKNEYINPIDPTLSYVNYPLVFLNMGKIIAAGGYWDGRLSLFSVENDSLIENYYHHNDTITAITSDHKENFLITGSKSGKCILWQISPELTKLTVKFVFYDHSDRVNSIFISNDLRLFATASNDGKINLYNFVVGQMIRTINHPENYPIQTVALSSSPLPCVIFYSSEDRSIMSYSINGRLLETIPEDFSQMTSPIILKDLNFIEVLVYGNEKGELYFRELPFLNIRKKWDVTVNSPVLSILLSKDKKYLFCGCGDGEFSVLTDPNFTIPSTRAQEELEKISADSK